jgi:hypothetical protein
LKRKIVGILVCMLMFLTAIVASGPSKIPERMTLSSALSYDSEQDHSAGLGPVEVEITKPLKGYLYMKDQQRASLKILTLIFGSITIEANVTGESIQRVEFYIDGVPRHTDYGAPYTWVWDELVLFRHTIKVVAYEYNGSFAEQTLKVLVFDIQLPSKQLTKDEAIQILVDEVIHPETLDHIVYAFTFDTALQTGDKIAPWLPDPLPGSVETFPNLTYRESQKPEWFFWVDDVPRGQFQHSNRFVFVDAMTGDVELSEEQWWPVFNDVSLWNSSADYWNPDNWAYTNDNLSGSVLLGYISDSKPSGRTSKTVPLPPGNNGAILINGWSNGQTGKEGFEDDLVGMGLFWGTYPGFDTVKVNPPNNKKPNIRDAFNDTSDNKDVVVYIAAHGGIDATGEPYVSCGGTKVTEDALCAMAQEHKNTTYKYVIQGCHSGGFIDSLKKLNNTAKIITACLSNESSYFDWDPSYDPNPTDKGSEFSSGFLEDLWAAWLNNPLIGILELLDTAFESAVAKDSTAIGGLSHPQVWERQDNVSPLIVITEPLNNTHVMEPMINVTGFAEDMLTGIVGLDQLWEWDGGSNYHNTSVAPPQHFIEFHIMISPLHPGWNRVTVGAVDGAGNRGTSSVVIFYVM